MSEVTPELTKAPRKAGLKMYKITFHGDGGNVEIGHNYRLNSYPRNVESLIDENYLGVVRDAVVTTMLQDEAGNKRHVSIPQYSFTVESV